MSGRWVILALALSGCSSYRVVQTSVFTDVDGNVIEVQYGRAEEYHVGKFISPANGKEVEFKSRLLVNVSGYGDCGFCAWQTFNPLRAGTMYRSDDEKWMFWAGGPYCRLFVQTPDRLDASGRPDYREVFVGVMGAGEAGEAKKRKSGEEEKWKVIPKAPKKR